MSIIDNFIKEQEIKQKSIKNQSIDEKFSFINTNRVYESQVKMLSIMSALDYEPNQNKCENSIGKNVTEQLTYIEKDIETVKSKF